MTDILFFISMVSLYIVTLFSILDFSLCITIEEYCEGHPSEVNFDAFGFFKFQVTTLPIMLQSFACGSLWRMVTQCDAVEQWIMVNLFQWSDCETHFAYTSQMLVWYEVIILHVARFIDSVNLLPSLGELTLTRFILGISVSNICPSKDLVSHLLAPDPGPNHARHAIFHLRVQSWHPIASSFLVTLGTVVSWIFHIHVIPSPSWQMRLQGQKRSISAQNWTNFVNIHS